MTTWKAQRLLTPFASERLRPARDLLSRVPQSWAGCVMPSIVDVGCGTGEASRLLLEKYPSSKLLLLDKSEERLSKAREDDSLSGRSTVSFACEAVEAHFGGDVGPLYDLVFSNAALHWCDALPELARQLLSRVRPGGSLAIQMPDMHSEPSHTLFKETAADLGLLPMNSGSGGPSPSGSSVQLGLPTNVASEQEYADTLLGATAGPSSVSPLCASLDMWSTTYMHALEGDDAVFNFVRTTYDGRQALLESFGKAQDSEEAKAFEEAYRERVTRAYPRLASKGITLYPFKRFFLVATRPGVLDML